MHDTDWTQGHDSSVCASAMRPRRAAAQTRATATTFLAANRAHTSRHHVLARVRDLNTKNIVGPADKREQGPETHRNTVAIDCAISSDAACRGSPHTVRMATSTQHSSRACRLVPHQAQSKCTCKQFRWGGPRSSGVPLPVTAAVQRVHCGVPARRQIATTRRKGALRLRAYPQRLPHVDAINPHRTC